MNTPPWWYSGDESDGDRADDRTQRPMGIDPSGLIAAANQLVDWATERIVTPHAEHMNPSDHPTCVLCRSASVISSLTPAESTDVPTMRDAQASPVRWIPTADQRSVSWD